MAAVVVREIIAVVMVAEVVSANTGNGQTVYTRPEESVCLCSSSDCREEGV